MYRASSNLTFRLTEESNNVRILNNNTMKRKTIGGKELRTNYDWKANAIQQIGVWISKRFASIKESYQGKEVGWFIS